ncbi:hypothetical protein ASF04_20050 [Duganella sp. Leaf61]|uniref:zeta toxin family protein n=1 Tax=Duganella sp. Leaf61 TaxID=1736227 RepID=UPI0006F309C3|nr:zeta toxin family protein [Duganella sp. Leaf61]KQN65206.1 hypothetical protein ASF04_20050 [Duganella sp. Leaf61]
MSDPKSSADQTPHVMMFAGPNGSGKTSLIDDIRQTGLSTLRGHYLVPERFINPDQVAKDLRGSFRDQDERDAAAQAAAVAARAEAIGSRMSFAFETVMSHPSRINEMLLLKEQGYRLFLVFITTDDPEKNVDRVRFRYETGTTTGHFVVPEKVRERYERTLSLLPRAVEVADSAYIYDNSGDFKRAKLQATVERNGPLLVAPDAKAWVTKRLVRPLQLRERELEQIAAAVEKKGLLLGATDELRGSYSGPVILKTNNFICQLDSSSGLGVVHDNLLLGMEFLGKSAATAITGRNEQVTIQYSMANAPRLVHLGDVVRLPRKAKKPRL